LQRGGWFILSQALHGEGLLPCLEGCRELKSVALTEGALAMRRFLLFAVLALAIAALVRFGGGAVVGWLRSLHGH
jgi:hypothetical protein